MHNSKNINKPKKKLGSLRKLKINLNKSGINWQGPKRDGYLTMSAAPMFAPTAWFFKKPKMDKDKDWKICLFPCNFHRFVENKLFNEN